jgi:hypothetical protein
VTYRHHPPRPDDRVGWKEMSYQREHRPSGAVSEERIWIRAPNVFALLELDSLIGYWNDQRPDLYAYTRPAMASSASGPVAAETAVRNRDRPIIMTPGGKRRVSVSAVALEQGGATITAIKLHRVDGRYEIAVHPEGIHANLDAAEIYGHRWAQKHLGVVCSGIFETDQALS